MKSTFRLLFLLCACALLHTTLPAQPPQGSLSLGLTLRDNQGKPLANTPVEFVETMTRKTLTATTNAEGKLDFQFNEGRYWQMNVRDIKNYYFWQMEVVPGKDLQMTRVITYDYAKFERETRPAVDRKALGLTTETQKFQPDAVPTAGNGVLKIDVKKANDSPLGNFPIAITCYKLRKTYQTQTNAAGIATFVVPLGNEYEIDIDGIPSYNYLDLPDRPGYRGSKSITYEPTIIDEKTVNDTTVQNLSDNQEGTSGRVIAKITFKGGTDGVWRNEPVFLEVLGDKQVYKGRTNQLGEARFLLPKGKKYMIHGRFQYNLDVIDLSRRRGIGYSHKTVGYRPLEKYQYPDRYIPKPDQLLLDAFETFLKKQYPEPEPGQLLSLQSKWLSPISASSKDAVLNIALTCNSSPDMALSQPLNICFVVDRSGSMAGDERIGNLKKSLAAFVGRLRPQDVVSLVIFDDHETVVIPAQAMGGEKARYLQAIELIEADGGTHIAKGLAAGYKELMKNFKAGRTNRLILLSDGFGSEPVEETLDAQKPYSGKGAECTTVGVGDDYNYALLKQLATNGGGLIEHVGNSANMEEVFMRQLSSILYPVAKDLELEVLFNKHLEYSQFYGFPLSERAPGRLKLKLRDMYAGLNQIGFLRFRVVDPQPGIQDEPVVLRLKYKDLKTGAVQQLEQKVPLLWSEATSELELVFDQQERKLYAIAVINQSLKAMSEKFHAGDHAAAHAALQDGLDTLKKVYPDAQDDDLEVLKAQVEQYLDIVKRQLK